MRNRIENTTRSVRENPSAAIVEYGFGGSGAIEASERRGQRQLVESEVLPSDMRGDFAALGFTFGEPVKGDEMFRVATLPTGWKRVGSDHAMWSYIVDERGIRRVAIFYKAAFYDRSAHMRTCDVGREVVSDALYGKTLPTAESMRLALLTPAELASVRKELDSYRVKVAESPDIYGDLAPNLAACDALMGAP